MPLGKAEVLIEDKPDRIRLLTARVATLEETVFQMSDVLGRIRTRMGE
jgi:hypothetical protein